MWVAALSVVIALAALAIVVPLFRPARRWDVAPPNALDLLFAEKARTLRALKDLDHEREAGILSDDDWKAARTEHLEDAVRLNREIEAITGVAPAPGEDA